MFPMSFLKEGLIRCICFALCLTELSECTAGEASIDSYGAEKFAEDDVM